MAANNPLLGEHAVASLGWAIADWHGLSAISRVNESELPNLELTEVEYVDLLLVHFPGTMEEQPKGSPEMRQEQWRALEDFHLAGKARAIGVSHYCERHIEDVLAKARVRPAINQVQYHVGMGTAGPNATDGIKYDRSVGVTYQSFSPLCGPCGTDLLITGPVVTEIGKKYNKTGAQVSLKWQVQLGIPIIPKSANPKHLAENLDMFDWTLSDEDMKTLTQQTKPPVAGGPGGVSGDCSIP